MIKIILCIALAILQKIQAQPAYTFPKEFSNEVASGTPTANSTTITTQCKPPCGTCYHSFQIGKGLDPENLTFTFKYEHVQLILQVSDDTWAGKDYFVNYHGANYHDQFTSDSGDNADDATVEEKIIVTLKKTTTPGIGIGIFAFNNPIGNVTNFFQDDHWMQFMQKQKCITCHGVNPDPKRKTADDGNCACNDGYEEYESPTEAPKKVCLFKCSNACNSLQCIEGQSDKCTTCADVTGAKTVSDFFEPECTTPTKGFYVQGLDTDGNNIYKSCPIQCGDCDDVDSCTSCGNGKNRVAYSATNNKCECKTGYHDSEGHYIDCMPCMSLCETCSQAKKCLTCKDGDTRNRELNFETGSCDCKMGYEQDEKNPEMCTKCYMLSDECIHICPEHTYQNEEKQICEAIEYSMLSNMVLIIILGALLAILQFVICMCIRTRLKNHHQVFYQQFHDQQMKLKQQRKFIYKDLEGHAFHKDASSSNYSHTKQEGAKFTVHNQQDSSMVSQQLNDIDTSSNKLLKKNTILQQQNDQSSMQDKFENTIQDQSLHSQTQNDLLRETAENTMMVGGGKRRRRRAPNQESVSSHPGIDEENQSQNVIGGENQNDLNLEEGNAEGTAQVRSVQGSQQGIVQGGSQQGSQQVQEEQQQVDNGEEEEEIQNLE